MALRRGVLKSRRPRAGDDDGVDKEMIVFGYACRVFASTSDNAHVQPALIPWQDDATLTMDRRPVGDTSARLCMKTVKNCSFDCRLYLSDLRTVDADTCDKRPNDDDEAEQLEEQMADEERYADMYAAMEKDADDEKNAHDSAADEQRTRAAIGFNYDSNTKNDKESSYETATSSEDEQIPYVANAALKVPVGVTSPTTVKQNAVIEKTAAFIAVHGTQMEIVIKAKQRNSTQFDFLDWEHPYNIYYRHVLKMIISGRYTPTVAAVDTDKPRKVKRYRKKKPAKGADVDQPVKDVDVSAGAKASPSRATPSTESDSDDSDAGYLHPSLMGGGGVKNSPKPESPALRGVHRPATPPRPYSSTVVDPSYKLDKANDIYATLFKNIQQIENRDKIQEGTKSEQQSSRNGAQHTVDEVQSSSQPMIRRPNEPAAAPGHQPVGAPPAEYNEWFLWFYGKRSPLPDGQQPVVTPAPPDLSVVINKTAEFVAKFGPGAEDHLRTRNEIHADFLDPTHAYYTFYQMRLRWLLIDMYHRQAHSQPPLASAPPPSMPPAAFHSLRHVPPPRPPPPPPLPMHLSASMHRMATIDTRAMVHRAGDGVRPLVSTMKFAPTTANAGVADRMHRTSSSPSTLVADTPASEMDVALQLERKRKAQAFLAQIMADKRAAREAQQRAHKEALVRHEQDEQEQKQVAAASKSDTTGVTVSGCERPPVTLSPSPARRRRRSPSPDHRSAARSTRRRERSPSPVGPNVSRKRSKSPRRRQRSPRRRSPSK